MIKSYILNNHPLNVISGLLLVDIGTIRLQPMLMPLLQNNNKSLKSFWLYKYHKCPAC